MTETIETAAEVVKSIRREGALVLAFPDLPGINICPASALTPERRATLSSLAKEVRAFVLDNPERNAVRRFAHLNGASIAWLDAGQRT
jgi:hypothetical protein